MTPELLLQDLRAKNVILWVEGGVLRCNAPKGLLDASYLANIARYKSGLIAHIERNTINPATANMTHDRTSALSFAQSRLWFLSKLDAESSAYIVRRLWRVRGELNIDALQSAIRQIVERHKVLRLVIGERQGQPYPRYLPMFNALKVIDASYDDVDTKMQKFHQELSNPMALARGPLFRAVLAELGAGDYRLGFVMHHAVTDAWSMTVLWRELSDLYRGYCAGSESALQPLRIQFEDYADWERRATTQELVKEQLTYWKEKLVDYEVLELPADRLRPKLTGSESTRLSFHLNEKSRENLHRLARGLDATLYMVLLAALKCLLSRDSGQTDITVGTAVSSRPFSELEPLLGFFTNTLALRTTIDLDTPFSALVSTVKTTCLGAFSHQDAPFERLVKELKPVRLQNRHPFFDVMFVMNNTAPESLALDGTVAELEELPVKNTKFDLTITITESKKRLDIALDFRRALFDEARIDRLGHRYLQVLDAIVATPEVPVNQLLRVSEPKRYGQFKAWHETHPNTAPGATIHGMFEACVERYPDRDALRSGTEYLTYRALDCRSNQLARYLTGLGTKPGDHIGLLMERDIDSVVAILGILKSGAAFVPLDVDWPDARLAFVIENAAIKHVLSRTIYRQCHSSLSCEFILLEAVNSETHQLDDSSVNQPADWRSLAYVLYTSGSTGRPKGVRIEHRSVVNYVLSATKRMGLADMTSYALVQTLSADSSGTSLYCALLSGATLHILSTEESLDGNLLADYMNRFDIDVLKILPSHFEALQAPDRISVAPRKCLILGGEMPRHQLVKDVLSAYPELKVFNHYGPTEATIAVTAGELDRVNVDDGNRYLPVGRPFGHCRIYILGDDMQPVPAGESGEVCLGGICLAQGYQNRDDLTAQVFVKDPYGDPGDRLYRTGDIGLWDAAGNLRIAGRSDHQVKIRGYRVEYGEINSVLRECPGVDETQVVLAGHDNGSSELVAFYVSKCGVSNKTLEAHAKSRLPEVMIPRRFFAKDSLPRISTGKADLNALRDMIDGPSSQDSNHKINGLEEKVLLIWRAVLGNDKLERDDNFFEAGGHSLLAAQLISRLSHELNRQIPLRYLFEHPHVSSLVKRLRLEGDLCQPDEVVKVRAHPRPERLPLSFAQTRVWFMDQFDGSKHFYNMHRTWRIRGSIDVGALESAFTEVLRRHEILRTVIIEHDGVLSQFIQAPGKFHIAVSSAVDSESDLTAQMKTALKIPFDLGNDLMIRATLFPCPDGTHILMVVVHHIASDAWSMSVMNRELSRLYDVFASGHSPELPPLPLQYADYSIWQRRWLEGNELRRQLGYWRGQLDGIERPELPLDRPRRQNLGYLGGREKILLSAGLTHRLRQIATTEDATLFMVLLCALKVLLSRYAGQDDISVGTPIANRHHREVEDLIGFFSNTLVLRTRIVVGDSFSTLLRRVKQTCVEAYEHQDLPFDRLVEELRPDREAGRHPLFDVLILLHNVPDEFLQLQNLDVEKAAFTAGIANFDLLLVPIEHETRIELVMTYRSELFNADTVVRLLQQLTLFLEHAARDPDAHLSSLTILGPQERRKLLTEFSGPVTPGDQKGSVVDMFESTVTRRQQSLAVVCDSRSMTYGDLNENTNRLAVYLTQSGVGPGDPVGVMLERGFDSIVALLAILKIGGIYVPLDIQSPMARLSTMVENISLRVLITDSDHVQHYPSSIERVVDLAQERDAILRCSVSNPGQLIDAGSTAYIMFTSGSTGGPKACVNVHGAFANLTRWQKHDFRLSSQARTLQYCTLSFDVSLQEILGCLTTGGTLVIVDEPTRRDPGLLARFIIDHNVERLFITSVALNDLLECLLGMNEGDCLRDVVSSGDQLRITPQVRDYFSHNGLCRLHNHYGPVETHLATALTLNNDPASWPELPSIGKPIDNNRVFILDQSMQLAPIRARGEICIAGPGVEGTYLNDDIECRGPFTVITLEDVDIPIYRTGDIGRYLPDGQVEFLGRHGDQVKIRGYRVALAEVEVALMRHADVHNAAVTVFYDKPDGTPHLAAYVVVTGQCDDAELRSYLAGLLPEYMIPISIVQVDALPRGARSKIDRKALPAPDLQPVNHAVTVPRNDIEQRLLELWQDILPVGTISVHDSFFDLGGHSLLAATLTMRLNRDFKVSMTIASLFRSPSIALLAESIKQHTRDGDAGNPNVPGSPTTLADDSTVVRAESEENKAQWASVESSANPVVYYSRPLEQCILDGVLAGVDAAAIGYIPRSVLARFDGDYEAAGNAWCRNRVMVRAITASPMGRIASIVIPMTQAQLSQEPGKLISQLIAAHDLAESVGAGSISLTGVLPSTTNYGLDLTTALCGRGASLKVTTGHDITSSTIVLSIEKLLRRCGRRISDETVGFLGLGAIGIRALRLMLHVIPHPPRLLLCDLYSRIDRLDSIADELVELGYQGDLEVTATRHAIPDSFYESGLIVGATNVPAVLEVPKLHPGTLLVDDSAPHCFDVGAVYARLKQDHDLLFTEGGLLEAPFSFDLVSYVDSSLDSETQRDFRGMIPKNIRNIGGCVLSSLMVQRFHGYEPAIGEIGVARCLQGYDLLSKLGFTAADPHCSPHQIPAPLVLKFVERHGPREIGA